MGRKVAWIVSILLLVSTAATGLYSGVSDLPYVRTAFQRSVTLGVLLYAVFGIAAAATLMIRHRAALWFTIAWAVVVTYVASTAALAYAGADATVSAAAGGGLGAALVGLFVIWCARIAIRPASLSERLQSPSSNPR